MNNSLEFVQYNNIVMSQRGNQNEVKGLSVLLVSTLPGFCNNLRSAIFRARKLTTYTLQVHLCESVDQVIDSKEIPVNVDFVVFGLDIQNANCIEQVKEGMKLLSTAYYSSGDYCIVISTTVPCFEMAVTWDSLQDLQTAYQMPMINGDTEDEDKCNYLGQRILRLMESLQGVHIGFPLLTASTCDEPAEESVVARRRLAFSNM